MAPTKKKGGKSDVVRFNIYLPREAYETLERLRQLSGKRSLAQTVRSALQLYLVVQEEMEEGKQIIVEDKDGKDRSKLRMSSF